MDTYSNPIAILRQLKGAPLSCLLALAFAGQPVGVNWLIRVTGYTDKTVTQAMAYLKEMGYANSTGRYDSWQLPAGFQLPFTLPMISGSRNFSDSNSATATIDSNLIESDSLSSSSKGSRKNSDSNCSETDSHPEKPDFQECKELLSSAGVRGAMVDTLAAMDHVNPEYLTAHISAAKAENIKVGLLIHRIRSNDLQPELPEDPAGIKDYTAGPFGKYINQD